MTTPLLPIPREIRDELLSGLDELDYAYGKTAEAANAVVRPSLALGGAL